MRRRGWIAGIALGIGIAGAIGWPASGQAGFSYGDLALTYTGTTTNWSALPSRDEQSTYDPCESPARLLGMGVYVHESAPTPPAPSAFALGRVYNVSVYPVDQEPGAPVPDATHQVADMLFAADDHDVGMGEATVCASNAGNVGYRSRSLALEKRARTTGRVSCPDGTQVTSGGVFVEGKLQSGRMISSAPFDDGDPGAKPDDGWTATADNLKRTRRDMVVHAICSDAGGFRYASERFSVRKKRRKHVETECPGGSYAVGSGVLHNARFRLATVVATHPGGTAYPYAMTVTEVDNLSRKRSRGEAFAICHS